MGRMIAALFCRRQALRSGKESYRRQARESGRGRNPGPTVAVLFVMCCIPSLSFGSPMRPGELPNLPADKRTSRRPHLSPEEILRRSIETGRTRSMKGTETIIVQQGSGSGGAMVSMTRQVIHSRDGYTLTKWLDPPSQRGTVVLDDGTWSRSYQPANGKVGVVKVSRSAAGVARPRDAKSAATLLRLILRNYRLAYEGIAPMAGRLCYKLRLTPVHGISNTVRMWIDQDTGAMLSHMESNAMGETLSVASFNGVEFPTGLKGADLRKAFPSRKSTKTAGELSFSRSQMLYDFGQVRKRVAFDFCPPYSMPGGYEFQYAEILSIKGVTTTCLRYSDGLADITICQNRSAEQRPAEFQSTQTMVDGIGNNIVDHKTGQMNFYLVGRCQMSGLLAVTNALSIQKEQVYLGYLASNYGLPLTRIAVLRSQGLGMDTLDALLAISRLVLRSPKQLSQRLSHLNSLVALCKQGYSWVTIGRRLGADGRALARITNHVRTFECR